MKSRIFAFVVALAGMTLSGAAVAAGGGALPYTYVPDAGNLPSLQRGARDFMAYCSGCHSMKYLRYNRLGKDLGIPDDMLKANLMFTSDKVGEHIISSLPAADAKTWFGQVPPDLTLETRARGPSWVYSYLLSFYVDTARPMGVNNTVLPGASMPHVLAGLQGWQVKEEAVHAAEGAEAHAAPHAAGNGLKLAEQGTMTPEEYKKFVGDLVNFMAYAAEPGKTHRIAVGFKALIYLLVLFVLAYLLKKEFWKDVH